MDKMWIPKGLVRTSFFQFLLWLFPWACLGLFGLYSFFVCFKDALNVTGMDNRFAFGIWIVFDLCIIALGAGAFFCGFLTYILKRKKLKAIINTAVIVGFVCYSGAMATLAVDIGQPARAWFVFWHANVHSMLTEVSFCISLYLMVLAIEYVPMILKARSLKDVPKYLVFEYDLHKIMFVFAGIGTFLSFFHQGSLGGMFGVMHGRLFAFREGVLIWPTTFFMFILSAIAVGPSFISIVVMLIQKITGKQLAKQDVFAELGKVSAILLSVYFVAKVADTAYWMFSTVPHYQGDFMSFYRSEMFGIWILVVEVFVFGLMPPLILLSKKRRQSMVWLGIGSCLACVGIIVNRYVMTIQTQSVPTLWFDKFLVYWPTWQEWGVMAAIVAYGVLLYSVSYRYLPLFPEERELALHSRRQS